MVMPKYKATWIHKVEFEVADDAAAHEFFWNQMNDGHLNAEPVEHGYVGFIKLESDGREVEGPIGPDDIWKLKNLG
jgi:hypothetical protein